VRVHRRSILPALDSPIVVLGTDDIASAVAHALFLAGWSAVLARDPVIPVLRRRMAFDDALVRGETELAGLRARGAVSMLSVMQVLHDGGLLAVTDIPADDLLCLGLVRGVVDARMRRHERKADLRAVAGFAVGLGPGYAAGENVHIAIETAPEATGDIIREGPTLAAHGRPDPIAGVGYERFSLARWDGIWRTPHAIGDAVTAGAVVGSCAGTPVRAPLGGRLRGLVRDGSTAPAGTRLLEVDPRGDAGQWSGIPPRAARIAEATLQAVRELESAEGGMWEAIVGEAVPGISRRSL
jgi:hypothetical protein